MMERIDIESEAREQLRDITGEVNGALGRLGAVSGICQVFVPHTTAGLVVNENADPAVCTDMLTWLDSAVPQEGPSAAAGADLRTGRYLHAEGNSPAHIKATLVGQSVTLPVAGGRLALGTWQGVFLAEFDGPRRRTIVVSVVGG